MTFCEGPPREGVIRLRCAYLELCTAISSRKRALPHGGHPLKYVASDSTMGQRRVGAVCAAIHAIEGHHPGFGRRQIVIQCEQGWRAQDAVDAHDEGESRPCVACRVCIAR